ncbi:spore-associated protein A [Streptomyces sp. NPDC058371]|uniref:spore-associated protein A n=1 Tax=Streptomyces sp. NPDC058371 TaxID=3346463 RepID=UPI00365FF64C
MNLSRRTVTAAALAVAALGGTAVFAGPAAAAPRTTAVAAADATAQAAYNGVCGTGYTVIDSTPVPDKGTVYVTYNKTTGKNCAVSIRNNPGTPVWMAVSLNIDAGRGAPSVTDSGSYSTYAGPIYLDAKGQCIQWNTAIDGVGANGHGHCG